MAEATDVLERQLTVGLYYSPITWDNITVTFAGENSESHDNGVPGGLSLDRDLNHGSPEYSAGVLGNFSGPSIIKALLILDNCIQEEKKRSVYTVEGDRLSGQRGVIKQQGEG
jgi:hypothetical protein